MLHGQIISAGIQCSFLVFWFSFFAVHFPPVWNVPRLQVSQKTAANFNSSLQIHAFITAHTKILLLINIQYVNNVIELQAHGYMAPHASQPMLSPITVHYRVYAVAGRIVWSHGTLKINSTADTQQTDWHWFVFRVNPQSGKLLLVLLLLVAIKKNPTY